MSTHDDVSTVKLNAVQDVVSYQKRRGIFCLRKCILRYCLLISCLAVGAHTGDVDETNNETPRKPFLYCFL